VALAQIAVTVPVLLLGSQAGTPLHVAHELGSFDMALAIGFLLAAWRPLYAHGMRTIVGAAALLLVATAVIDLISGHAGAAEEAPRLLAVVGWLLLARLAALTPPAGPAQEVSPDASLARLARGGELRWSGRTRRTGTSPWTAVLWPAATGSVPGDPVSARECDAGAAVERWPAEADASEMTPLRAERL
jgi:hypothetical protein